MRFELELAIAAPPQEIFDFLADPSNLPRWQESCIAAEPRGDRILETRSFMGRRAQVETEILEQERPRLFTVRSAAGPVRFTVRHELEASESGTTMTVTGEGDAALVPGFASGIMARRAEKQFRKDFERLKKRLEHVS